MNWLLVAVVAVLLVFAFIGHQKGMLRIVFSFGSLLIALLVSYLAAPYMTELLKDQTALYTWVQEKSTEFVNREAQPDEEPQASEEQEDSASAKNAAQDGDIGSTVADMLDGLSLPTPLRDQIEEAASQAEAAEEATVAQVKTQISNKMAELAVSAIGFAVTLLIARIVLWILYAVLDMVSRLPVIHGINQTVGMVVGLAEGLLLVWIFFALLTCLMQTQFGRQCLEWIAESRLLSFLYEYNILRMFF